MNKRASIFLIIIGFFSVSCEGFLEEKPVKSILVPSTVEDIRAILDNYTTLNSNSLASFILSDDWVTSSANWEALNPWEQNAYLWHKEIFQPQERSVDYNRLHRKIFFANNCLDILEGLENQSTHVAQLKGEALFVRSLAMIQLGQLFLPHFESSEAEIIKIPIRFSAVVTGPSQLMGINGLFQRAEQDLLEARNLLPEKAAFPNRPDKRSAAALLSNVYLYWGKYDLALTMSLEVLDAGIGLMDYKKLNPLSPYPFKLFNEETLYYGVTSSFSVTASSATWINPDLIKRYSTNDLRRSLYFNKDAAGNFLYKGSYLGDFNLFSGIGISEVLLNGAESAFRLGRATEGQSILIKLIKNRYGDVNQWIEENKSPDLNTVLEERRKELVFRGSRWSDMKRLAAIGELKLPLIRKIRGSDFFLERMDQFSLKLPEIELALNNP
ncbi:MAG: RagB/SusD family nutrient uptake outer membrane protein [Algoriphagus sp.]|uniref:RagB/SusD family nutrient uptake outer membrane protein n=1 Tax=Algoriphagus sp. TaxID=1872435 RepID=UPI0027346E66|nr:RagB/SusD family nutrient uptake outer membrane protein [Algoriphagus sp.]MDP3198930.1 RagB/SusD family nutrient uptake outer membrane protein [Algoriphagus sp.]